MKKPSDYRGFPFGSIAKNNQSETIARNIMTIMHRNGDEFQPVSAEMYRTERLKDGATDKAIDGEMHYYNSVIEHMQSPETVEAFCKGW